MTSKKSIMSTQNYMPILPMEVDVKPKQSISKTNSMKR